MDLGVVASVVISLGAVLLTVFGLPRLIHPTASVPVTPRGCFMKMPATFSQRALVPTGCLAAGAGAALLFEHWLMVPAPALAALAVFGWRSSASAHAAHLDHEGITVDDSPTMPWSEVSSVDSTDAAWVLSNQSGQQLRISKHLNGSGCLAMHVDDNVPPTAMVNPSTRAELLQGYRDGLKEADEDPDAWLSNRSGVLTAHARVVQGSS